MAPTSAQILMSTGAPASGSRARDRMSWPRSRYSRRRDPAMGSRRERLDNLFRKKYYGIIFFWKLLSDQIQPYR